MRRLLIAITLLTAVDARAQDPASAVAELEAMQHRLLRAVLAGRGEEWAAMLADDWRVTHVDGRVRTRAQVLREAFGGDPTIVAGEVDDIEVRVYGDAAVTTGRSTWTARAGGVITIRFTDVAVRRDGRWLIVSSHATAVQP